LNTLAFYLISISLLIAISAAILRIPVRRDYLNKGRLTIGTAILQTSIFFAFGGLPIIYLPGDWPTTNVHLIFRAIGLFSLTIGVIVIFVGMFRLGILRSFGLQSGTLKAGDFYRLTRNPQVLGCFLYVIGFIHLWPSWYALGWGVSLVLIIHLMVLTEEEYLRKTYDQLYIQYCKRVPRYLGTLKKSVG